MLTTPVLQLNPERVGDIDPRDVSSLFGMWTGTNFTSGHGAEDVRELTTAVFNRCAQSIPDGKRLENLSWRVWARETLCCPPQPEDLIVPAIDVSPTRSSGVPSLAGSIDTEPDEDSALSKSRGKEPHINSKVLEKMMINIQEKSALEPLSPTIEAVVNAKMQASSPMQERDSLELTADRQPYSNESSCISTTTAATGSTARQSEHRDSETSASSVDGDGLIRSGSIVKGFSPAPSSFRASKAMRLNSARSNSLKPNGNNLIPSKAGMFTLGGSSEEDESSFEQRMSFKRPTLEPRQSSLSHSLTKDSNSQKKVTSFRDIVEQRRIMEASENDEGAIASDSDDDDVIDSAISEEDEDDWEEMATDDEKQARDAPAPVFKRIDSRPNLVSRRSILTQGLTEGERASGLLNAASRSASIIGRGRAASHNGPSIPGSPEENEVMMMQAQTGPKPLPVISTTSNTYAMAQSPRATRRAMLSTELTESLRKNMLLERQGKQANLPFIRRQAASMANLQRANGMQSQPPANVQPTRPAPLATDPSRSWTEFENPWEYHTKGW